MLGAWYSSSLHSSGTQSLGTERKQLQIFSALKRLTVPSWDYILISYDYETTARWTYLQLKVILFLAVLQLGSSAASSRGLHVRYGSWPPGILSWVTRCCQAPMNYKKKEGSSLRVINFQESLTLRSFCIKAVNISFFFNFCPSLLSYVSQLLTVSAAQLFFQ